MVWWSFVLGIVGGILLSGAFSVFVYKHMSKWIDELNQD